MTNYYFEREVRTPYSEVYTILEEDVPIGRVDLHYIPGIIHATLCVSERLTQEGIQDLIDTMDEDVVDAVGIAKEEFIIHVHQGRDLGVWSKEEFGGNGNGNGERS